jgi:polynucleotide 5'-hydroxyl-kinase GRC3/NOL9
MIVEEYWKEPLSEIKKNKKIIYITGETDTGKSTFTTFLLHALHAEYSTGFLDCDPGQTTIGPPGTAGLGIYVKAEKNLDVHSPDAIYLRFIGSTTPSGHLLQTVSGVKRLAEKAMELDVDKLIVDSSGFVKGEAAREFQFHLLDLLKPDYIIEIYHTYSLKSLLNHFARSAEIIRMKASDSVKQKTPLERRSYREDRFRSYFKPSRLYTLEYKNIGFHGRIPWGEDGQRSEDILLALENRNHFVITLGIIKEMDRQNQVLKVHSPPFTEEKVASIHFGSIQCDLLGTHS